MSGVGAEFCGPRRRPGRPRGPVREALTRAIAGGLVGPLDVLAAHTGWPPEQVRNALKEMSRAGDARVQRREPTGQRGQPRGVYGQPERGGAVDALAGALAGWR